MDDIEVLKPIVEDEKTKSTKSDNDEYEIVEIDDEGNEKLAKSEDSPIPEDDSDENLSSSEGEEDEFVETNKEKSLETGEQKRERRKLERQQRKEARHRAKIDRFKKDQELYLLRNEVNNLRQKIHSLDGSNVNREFADLDNAIRGAEISLRNAEGKLSESVSRGDGNMSVEAQNEIIDSKEAIRKLKEYRENAVKSLRQSQNGASQNKESMETIASHQTARHNGQLFFSKNNWVDPNPNSGDEDSRLVHKFADDLFRSGYDPRTAQYWQVLENHVREEFPEHYQKSQQVKEMTKTQRAKLTVAASPSGNANGSGRMRVELSPGRVEALKQLGVWGNQKLMKPYIEEYRKYDEQNKGRN